MYHKYLSCGTILLFLLTMMPMVVAEDTTPPVTTISFDPPVPDGLNGWYVTQVVITFNATDDDSGVNNTYYRLNNETWIVYSEPLTISTDGRLWIEYYSIDFAGNQEPLQNAGINIDQTEPDIDLTWELIPSTHDIILTADCNDETSGMDYVEFFMDDELQKTDDLEPYECILTLNISSSEEWHASGLILFKEINETAISMFAFFVIIQGWTEYPELPLLHAIAYDNAGNTAEDCIPSHGVKDSDLYLIFFQPLKLINDFIGTVTRFHINADFNQNPII